MHERSFRQALLDIGYMSISGRNWQTPRSGEEIPQTPSALELTYTLGIIAAMDFILLWSFLRVLISLAAAGVSSLRPMSILEKSVALWPPTPPIESYLERVLISPLFRWDAHIYATFAVHGSSIEHGTASFHPLYPLLARPFMVLGLSPELSLILVSNLAGLGFLYYFYRLARLDYDHEVAHTSVHLLLFSPLSFLFFVPYSESLFLLFSAISFLTCRKQKWWLAGIAGGLATLTRQQGLFLVIPLAWELWEESQRNFQTCLKKWKNWIGISLIPLTYTGWVLYRGFILNDVSYNFNNPLDAIYSVILSPSHTQVVPEFRFLFPWQAVSLAIDKIRLQPDIDIWTNIILGGLFLVAAVLAWPRVRISYRLFILVNFLVAISLYTGPVHPYMGLPRHMWLAFPVFLGIGQIIKKPWSRILVTVLGILMMIFLLVQYVLESWVT